MSLGRGEGLPLEATSSLMPPRGSLAPEMFTPQIQQHIQDGAHVSVVRDIRMLDAIQVSARGRPVKSLTEAQAVGHYAAIHEGGPADAQGVTWERNADSFLCDRE